MFRSTLTVLTVLLFVAPAFAQTTWHVNVANCPGPGDGSIGNPYCSIQFAIIVAVNGDEIVVAPGMYNETINFFSKALTVRSEDPTNHSVVESTIIEATGVEHVVQCISGEGPGSVLSGFVITGGDAPGPDYAGGGMYIVNSSPTVSHCVFVNNVAEFGGGIYIENGSPSISYCLFTDCGAYNDGGGAHNDSGDPTFMNCVFTSNQAASDGGGFSTDSGNPVLTDCTFIGNSAGGTGGGGAVAGVVEMIGCDVIRNTGGITGGGVEGAGTFTDCRFVENSGIDGGGAMFLYGIAPTVITRCTFDGNYANGTPGTGKAIYGAPTIIDSGFCNHTGILIDGAWIDGGGNSLQYCMPSAPAPDPCPADTNGDGVVDVTDLLNLLAAWGSCPGF